MNILIICHSLTKGGSEKVAANVSIALNEQHHVWIHCVTSLQSTYSYSGQIVKISKGSATSFLEKAMSWITYLARLSRFCHETNIDAVIAFDLWPNVVAHLIPGRMMRIGSVHNDVEKHLLVQRLHRKMMVYFYPSITDGFVAVSQGVCMDIKALSPLLAAKTVVINNAASDSFGSNILPARQRRASDVLTLLCCGRLTYQKGQDLLLRALAQCGSHGPRIRTLLLGDGPAKDDLAALARELRLDVEFLGYKDDPLPIFAAADLLIVPSRFEGFGNVIVEAMSSGMGIVATDCRVGPRELLGGRAKDAGSAAHAEYLPHGILIPDPTINEDRMLAVLIEQLELIRSGRRCVLELSERAGRGAARYQPKYIAGLWRDYVARFNSESMI